MYTYTQYSTYLKSKFLDWWDELVTPASNSCCTIYSWFLYGEAGGEDFFLIFLSLRGGFPGTFYRSHSLNDCFDIGCGKIFQNFLTLWNYCPIVWHHRTILLLFTGKVVVYCETRTLRFFSRVLESCSDHGVRECCVGLDSQSHWRKCGLLSQNI